MGSLSYHGSRILPSLFLLFTMMDSLPFPTLCSILGAGFAISDASKTSGLSLWLGNGLKSLKTLPPFALLLVTGIMTTSLTEIASNSATANILLPILAEMASSYNASVITLPSTSVLIPCRAERLKSIRCSCSCRQQLRALTASCYLYPLHRMPSSSQPLR